MRSRLKARTILIVCILIGVVLLCHGLFRPDEDVVKTRVVLCFQPTDEINKRYKKENSINMDDCRESLVDYNKEAQTILYINYENEFVEKNISTGKINKLNITDENEDMGNLQYGPGSNEISYIKDGSIYIYDREERKTRKITESDYSQWRNTYAWRSERTLYTINKVGDKYLRKLFVWNENGKKVPIINTDTIQCLTLCDNENKIYGILEKAKFNGITMELLYELTEIDLINQTSRKLADVDTMSNLLLECIDNKYLIYVETDFSEKKSKVYCYDIEKGKKKCIYKTTSERIVGVIVK